MKDKVPEQRDEKLSAVLNKEYPISSVTKTYVRCWWVIFDVNGNAPSDAEIVPCAIKALAHDACDLYARMKDADEKPSIVIKGTKHYELMGYSVEGYNFDTCYSIREGWAEEGTIITSLAQLVKENVDVFDCEEDTKLNDGVYFEEGEDEGDEEEAE